MGPVCARVNRGWCASAHASARADASGAGDSQEEDLPELLKMSTTRAIWVRRVADDRDWVASIDVSTHRYVLGG